MQIVTFITKIKLSQLKQLIREAIVETQTKDPADTLPFPLNTYDGYHTDPSEDPTNAKAALPKEPKARAAEVERLRARGQKDKNINPTHTTDADEFDKQSGMRKTKTIADM